MFQRSGLPLVVEFSTDAAELLIDLVCVLKCTYSMTLNDRELFVERPDFHLYPCIYIVPNQAMYVYPFKWSMILRPENEGLMRLKLLKGLPGLNSSEKALFVTVKCFISDGLPDDPGNVSRELLWNCFAVVFGEYEEYIQRLFSSKQLFHSW